MAQRQQDYYARTASAYEPMHVQPGDEHFIALEYAAALLAVVGAKSVLDVGSGTGRVVRFLRQHCPEMTVDGIEPVAELRKQAQALGTVLDGGAGDNLPFGDASYDIVTAFGVMHHVSDPARVIAEMTRVARCGVMISDANRFGQGHAAVGVTKWLIHRAGLWSTFELLRTRGRGYLESAGDGIFYSYSIFDSMAQVQAWADRAFVIPTMPPPPQKRNTILQISAPHGLLVAFREPSGPGWAGF